jgi:hypothetical protein
MDEKIKKEVDLLLEHERTEIIKELSLLSWFRTWLWLVLVQLARGAKEYAEGRRVNQHAARYCPRPRSFRTRMRNWLATPFRALRLYRYSRLSWEAKRAAEDAWLVTALKVLNSGVKVRRGFRCPSISVDHRDTPPICRSDIYEKPLQQTGCVSRGRDRRLTAKERAQLPSNLKFKDVL